MYKGNNPSALRSQQMIVLALIDLMREYAYSEISITMLSTKAGVSRQTFYKMFASKEDVVGFVARTRCLDLELSLIKFNSISLEELAEHTFRFFRANIELIRQLTTNHLQGILQDQAQRALTDLLACFHCDDGILFDASNRAFIAGGLCAMLSLWAEQNDTFSPTVQAKRFSGMFTIKSFTRNHSIEESMQMLLATHREG